MITVRDANADDLDFIIHSFLMGFWGSPAIRGMDRDEYFSMMRPRFKAALANPAVHVRVACVQDDPNTLVGWSAHVGETLIWAYVRKPMRQMGVFKTLIGDTALTGYALPSQHIAAPRSMRYRPHVGWLVFAHG